MSDLFRKFIIDAQGDTQKIRSWMEERNQPAGEIGDAAAEMSKNGSRRWERALLVATVAQRAGDLPLAIELTEFALMLDPDREPLRTKLATLLVSVSKIDIALEHARRAYELVPGVGQAAVLADCLVALGRLTEAREFLSKKFHRSAEPLEKIALVAADEAPDVHKRWEEHVRKYPNDVDARLRFALALFGIGAHRDSANVAWGAFERDGRRSLRPRQLWQVAVLQRSLGSVDEVVARTVQLATSIRERAPQDAGSETLYFDLWQFSGGALPEPDFALLRASGFLRSVAPTDATLAANRAAVAEARLSDAYVRGQLPIRLYAALTSTPIAVVVERARLGLVPLSTPVLTSRDLDGIATKQLLLGPLELCLLASFGVEASRVAMACGRLFVFSEDIDIIAAELEALRLGSARPTYERISGDYSALLADSKTEKIAVSSKTDVELAAEQNARMLKAGARQHAVHLSVGDVHPHELEPGSRFYLAADAIFVLLLERMPLLEELQRADATLVIGPEAAREFSAILEQLELSVRAEITAQRTSELLHELRELGALTTISRPTPRAPTAARVPQHQNISDAVVEALSTLEFMDTEERVVVSADYFSCSLLRGSLNAAYLRDLGWTVATYDLFHEYYVGKSSRIIDFASFLLSLLNGDQLAHRVELSTIGFQGALQSQDLCVVLTDARYSEVRRRQVLAASERFLHTRAHAGQPMARLELVALYVATIWNAWKTRREFGEEVSTLLFARANEFAGLLPTLLELLFLSMFHDARSAYRQDAGELTHDETSSASGMAWKWLFDWASSSAENWHLLGRSVRGGVLRLFSHEDVVSYGFAQAGPLVLGAFHPPDDLRNFRFDTPGLFVLSLLSAFWTDRPALRMFTLSLDVDGRKVVIDLEAVLETGVALLEKAPGKIVDDGINFAWTAEVDGARLRVTAPAEALLLRAPGHVASLVDELAPTRFAHDARLGQAFLALSDGGLQERVSVLVAAIKSPSRSIREDPASLLGWGDLSGGRSTLAPTSLAELREVLCEMPLDQSDIFSTLAHRFDEGGSWVGPFAAELQERVSSSFAPLCLGALATRMQPSRRAEEIGVAVRSLRRAKDLPAGRLASEVAMLRLSAHLGFEFEQESVATILPIVLEDVLTHLINGATSGVAALDAPVLRACHEVVRRLGSLEVSPPRLVEVYWLTHQLAIWFWANVRFTASDDFERCGDVVRAAFDNARTAHAITDLADPNWFGRDAFDHRLASFLLGLYLADAVATENASSAHAKLLTEGAEAMLVALAQRPYTSAEETLAARGARSVLGWDGGCTVPDLAVAVLGRLSPELVPTLPKAVHARCLDATQPNGEVLWSTSAVLLGAIKTPEVRATVKEYLERTSSAVDVSRGFAVATALASLFCIDAAAPIGAALRERALAVLLPDDTTTAASIVRENLLQLAADRHPGLPLQVSERLRVFASAGGSALVDLVACLAKRAENDEARSLLLATVRQVALSSPWDTDPAMAAAMSALGEQSSQ